MSRAVPARLPSAFTRFSRLLTLPDQIAGLFRARRSKAQQSVKLGLEPMEERVVLNGQPLPHPALFVGSGVGEASVVKGYSADTGALRFSTPVFGSSALGVHVAAGDLTGSGTPDAIAAQATGFSGHITVLDGTTGAPISGQLGNFDAFARVFGGVSVAAADVEGDGRDDIIAAAETLNGPEVKVFDGVDGHVIAVVLPESLSSFWAESGG
jgi:hypothetical protein